MTRARKAPVVGGRSVPSGTPAAAWFAAQSFHADRSRDRAATTPPSAVPSVDGGASDNEQLQRAFAAITSRRACAECKGAAVLPGHTRKTPRQCTACLPAQVAAPAPITVHRIDLAQPRANPRRATRTHALQNGQPLCGRAALLEQTPLQEAPSCEACAFRMRRELQRLSQPDAPETVANELAMSDAQVEDFWLRVDRRGGQYACWPWIGTMCRAGYGRFSIQGKRREHKRKRRANAHRISFSLARGPVPAELFVCHRCDNPPCCNPAHLFLGTHTENMRDMYAKGRKPSRKGVSRTLPREVADHVAGYRERGERPEDVARDHGIKVRMVYWLAAQRGLAPGGKVVTDEMAAEIRALAASGLSFIEIGKRVGVSRRTAAKYARVGGAS
jgi:hypothetical protein